MSDLRAMVPIKIKIYEDGHAHGYNHRHRYPSFKNLPCVVKSGLAWHTYIDVYGLGWHYDKKYGHSDVGADTPSGTWLGVLVMPEIFVTEAIKAFGASGDVVRLTETELIDFYDNRAHIKEPEEIINAQILADIKAKEDAGIPLTQAQEDAKDPSNDAPGRRTNKKRYWADYKAMLGVEIVET